MPPLPQTILDELQRLAEPKYRDFSAALIPGVEKETMLGVRMPLLRKIAKRLAKEGYLSCTARKGETFEETMLRGMLPGYADQAALQERLAALEAFVPDICNWSVCDSCSATCHFVRKYKEEVWTWLQPYLRSKQEFPARFGIVMLLNHYCRENKWVEPITEALRGLQAQGFYAAMGAAWCACELYLHHASRVPTLLEAGFLRDDVRLLTLRKLRESRRSPRA